MDFAASPENVKQESTREEQSTLFWQARHVSRVARHVDPAAGREGRGGPCTGVVPDADADGGLRLWRPSDGELLHEIAVKGSIVASVAFSPDGKHWKAVACPQTGAHGDAHNNAFWAPELEKYVLITLHLFYHCSSYRLS